MIQITEVRDHAPEELSILDKTHGEVLRARCDVGMIQ